MQKLVELRQKIKTVTSIKSVTKTLATVSAAKLSRVKYKAAGLRDYTARMREVLEEQQASIKMADYDPAAFSPLLGERSPVKKAALLVVTGDRGMCGNYNLAAVHLALDFLEQKKSEGVDVDLILKGQKGEYYLKKRGLNAIRAEGWPRYGVSSEDARELIVYLSEMFLTGKVDEVYSVFTHYYSPVNRVPVLKKLLPLKIDHKENTRAHKPSKWHYEPSIEDIIKELVNMYIEIQVFDLLIESYASEQGARMITMEEASERADKALADYRVKFNRLRRESITIDLLGALFATKVVAAHPVLPETGEGEV